MDMACTKAGQGGVKIVFFKKRKTWLFCKDLFFLCSFAKKELFSSIPFSEAFELGPDLSNVDLNSSRFGANRMTLQPLNEDCRRSIYTYSNGNTCNNLSYS